MFRREKGRTPRARTRMIRTAALVLCAAALSASAQLPTPRLYVFDCGTLAGRNLKSYDLPPEARDLSVPCFLIVHSKGMLFWDTGLGDEFADGHPKQGDPGWHVQRTLRGQLDAIGVSPKDVTYLAISHMHADHTGNANMFAGATWLVQEPERTAALAAKNTDSYKELANGKTVVLHGDYDVFGDSSVVIISTPGHTPGHQSLLVRLPKTGAVLLTGDLYHYPEERTHNTFPTFEYSKAKSAASRARVEDLLKATHARLWIGHDIKMYSTLKLAPAFYQ